MKNREKTTLAWERHSEEKQDAETEKEREENNALMSVGKLSLLLLLLPMNKVTAVSPQVYVHLSRKDEKRRQYPLVQMSI